MDITKSTVVELKALAFDELVKIETAQKNVQMLNQELAKRETEVKPEVTPEPTT
jgi:hypothetical protein